MVLVKITDRTDTTYNFHVPAITLVETQGSCLRVHLVNEIMRLPYDTEEEAQEAQNILLEAMENTLVNGLY